ncbi:MAG TPA: hypothetical protein VFV66_17395 [Nonomuraea sp.]|nr:hypothetical protein [Nonomuraea sp.]
MTTTTTTPATTTTDVEDLAPGEDFDLYVRISVLPDVDGVTAGFSTWASCAKSCSNTSWHKCC